MSQITITPFIYGRPVQGEQFFGRQREIKTVLNRLYNRESTAVVGPARIGKTSFLKHLVNSQVLIDALGKDFTDKITPHFLDLHDLPDDYNQEKFWQDVLAPLVAKPRTNIINHLLKESADAHYDRRTLQKIFSKLAEEDHILFLLLDEFEVLINHKKFQDPSFFAGIRKISSHIGGLVVVVSSRLPLEQMNKISENLLEIGSPFFNIMAEVRLKPFDTDTINQLLSQKLIDFNDEQRTFIIRMAGRQPLVLQAMAAALYENINNPIRASEICYEHISFHFADLWQNMSENHRTIVIILSLVELNSKLYGEEFRYVEIENNERFGVELRQLVESGLVNLVQQSDALIFDWEHLLIWHGQKWAIGSQLFAWWIRDQVLNNSAGATHDWLMRKQYIGLLTQENWQIFFESRINRSKVVDDSLRWLASTVLKRRGK